MLLRGAPSRSRAAGRAERTHAERLASRDGYFAPDSVIRRIGNSPLTPFLGGGPAVLLQVAHPLVATGVTQHSDYRRELWRRLLRTLRALYLIVFGTKVEAEEAGAAVQRVHARVQGQTQEQLGPFPAGTPYSASDPELRLWVHATLVEASLAVYSRFVQPLSADEQERYYQEMAVVARLFGTPAHAIPPTLAHFRDYFEAQIGDEKDHCDRAGEASGRGDRRGGAAGADAPPRPRPLALDGRTSAATPPRGVRTALESPA